MYEEESKDTAARSYPVLYMGGSRQSALERRNAASEIILNGNISKAVWFLAWPTTLQFFISQAYMLINAKFVGMLPHSTLPFSAMAVSGPLLNIQFGLIMGISVGTSALVSRFIGAQNDKDAVEAARQSLILGTFLGLATGLLMSILAGPLVMALGAERSAAPMASDYLAIIAYSSIPSFIFTIGFAILRSLGDAKGPLLAGAAMMAVNAVLDWLLILGPGSMHGYGLRGAAVATGISRMVCAAVTIWLLSRSHLSESLKQLVPHWGWFKRVLAIGWPAALMQMVFSFSGWALNWVFKLSPITTTEVMAAQGALRTGVIIEGIAYMPGVAYGNAATPLVGQNLGARQPQRAEHAAWTATVQAMVIMGVIALLFLIIPRQLVSLFLQDKTMIALAASYLFINSFSEPILAINMVLRGALQGAGDTIAPALITIISTFVVRVALAFILAVGFGLGPTGVWIAICVTAILSGILTAAWFKWGSWRTLQL